MEKDQEFYWGVLGSNGCACGRHKDKGKSVCYGCFKLLPPGIRQGLYLQMGAGYEEAYEEAVEFLAGEGRA